MAECLIVKPRNNFIVIIIYLLNLNVKLMIQTKNQPIQCWVKFKILSAPCNGFYSTHFSRQKSFPLFFYRWCALPHSFTTKTCRNASISFTMSVQQNFWYLILLSSISVWSRWFASCLPGLKSDPDNESSTLLQNISFYQTTQHHITEDSSNLQLLQWELLL